MVRAPGSPVFPVAALLMHHSTHPVPLSALVFPAEGQGGKGLGTDPLGSVAWALSQPWISYPFALDLVFPSLKWGNDS